LFLTIPLVTLLCFALLLLTLKTALLVFVGVLIGRLAVAVV